jgi:hypothetical protein
LSITEFVIEKHKGQRYEPYGDYFMFHLFPVGALVPDGLYPVGIGHDLFEDTDATEDELFDVGYTPREVQVIRILTHQEGEPYTHYIKRVREDDLATLVKIADITINLTNLHGLPLGRQTRMVRKYYDALRILAGREE